MERVSVVFVDDERNIRSSVQTVLEAAGYRVRTFGDGHLALAAMLQEPPDVCIFDIKMPHMDGMELFRQFRNNFSAPVIFLTSKDEEEDQLTAFDLGAADYIIKPFSMKLLVARLNAVLRRTRPEPGRVSEMIELVFPPQNDTSGDIHFRLDIDRHICEWNGKTVIGLTVTEVLLLAALARRPGVVFRREELLSAIDEDEDGADGRSIDQHVKRIRNKLSAIDGMAASVIKTVYGAGYCFLQARSSAPPEIT